MRIAVHMGLHKTGSTSLQNSFARSPRELARAGICYPSPPGNSQFSGHHNDVVELLRRGDSGGVNAQLQHFEGQANERGLDTVLLSSETFSTLRRPRLLELDEALSSQFSEVQYFCVFRSIRDLLRSKLKQQLVHNGVSLRDSKKVASICEGACRSAACVVDTLSGKLRIVSYSDAIRSEEGFCNSVLSEGMAIAPIGMKERRDNTSADFFDDPSGFLTAVLREAISLELGVNPYSPAVNQRLKKALSLRVLRKAFRSRDELKEMGQTMKSVIDDTAKQACEANMSALKEQFPSLVGTEILGKSS